jgi:Transposase DDE domain group 1
MDATLVTASSDKEGAAPAWKKGYGFQPLGAWAASTRECLAMLLRPGNAGSNTFTDHEEVLAAALRQVPARHRRKILVHVDGAGASHDLVNHLLSLSSPRRTVLFTLRVDDHRRRRGRHPPGSQRRLEARHRTAGPRTTRTSRRSPT